ncbi:MAG: class I SAM-dependent methyltransferase [Thiomargarita sp.]|nr:class I SAM-dependent methyltransferase [Thiomargarita sp.]
MDILNQYIKKLPSYQNALDIFKEEWSSKLPPPYSELTAGNALLFQDPRIDWAIQQLNGVKGNKILELGPLEGGHTYMLENSGANSILAIESNTRSYLKCLITKEILNLKQAHFQLGDFIHYLKHTQEYYDVCIASGVLYHMKQPAELIHLISKVSRKVVIWTHYYDQKLIKNNPNIKADKFSADLEVEYEGFKHIVHKQNYQDALGWAGFCGGGENFSMWLSRQDILSCLNYFGFNELRFEFEQADHPNGPSFCLVGVKSDG